MRSSSGPSLEAVLRRLLCSIAGTDKRNRRLEYLVRYRKQIDPYERWGAAEQLRVIARYYLAVAEKLWPEATPQPPMDFRWDDHRPPIDAIEPPPSDDQRGES
jgi:hypothetical protein